MAYTKKQIEEAKDFIVVNMIKGQSLNIIIKNNKEIPCARTVFNWLNPLSDYHDAEFLHNYARAQEIRAETEFEEIKEIADSTGNDIILDKDGNEVVNHNVINRDRLRIDARKWRISKMQPKKYGDHNTLILEGGEKPVTISFKD
jgi:hypothetical protein